MELLRSKLVRLDMHRSMMKSATLPFLHATLLILWLPFWVDLASVHWGTRCYWPAYPNAVSGAVIPDKLPVVSIGRDGVLRVSDGKQMALPVEHISDALPFFRHLVAKENTTVIEIRAANDTPYTRIEEVLSAVRETGMRRIYLYTELPH